MSAILQRRRQVPRQMKEGLRMNYKNRKHHVVRTVPRVVTVLALVAGATVVPTQTARAQDLVPPTVPAGLEVPAGNQVYLVGHGVGTQNYECQPTGAPGHVAFVLFTPEATLFDDQPAQLITHFFSPNPVENGVVRVTWQDSADTSTVWARAIASATVDPKAVAWLLLQAVGTKKGPTGGDTLSDTTF